jgi:hypothetical protein
MAIKVIAEDTVTSADPVNLRILVIPTHVVALSRGTPLEAHLATLLFATSIYFRKSYCVS